MNPASQIEDENAPAPLVFRRLGPRTRALRNRQLKLRLLLHPICLFFAFPNLFDDEWREHVIPPGKQELTPNGLQLDSNPDPTEMKLAT